MLIFTRYSWWLGAMVGLAVFLTALGRVGVLSPLQGVLLRVAEPPQELLSNIFEPIAAFMTDAGNLNELQEENRQLRLDKEALQAQVVELQRQSERARELESALGIVEDLGATTVAANIVSRNFDASNASISIDRGSDDGIREGMVVLSSQGSLMGTVIQVTSGNAFVRLVTDSRSRVSAQVRESKVEGSLKGDARRGISFDYSDANVAVGDTIVTSGLGGTYPANILIGTVSEVVGNEQDLFPKVKVEPAVRFSSAQTVLVNTSFVPQRISVDSP